MDLSKIRTNYHASSEALMNKQINMELHASYVYMSMVSLTFYNINIQIPYISYHFNNGYVLDVKH